MAALDRSEKPRPHWDSISGLSNPQQAATPTELTWPTGRHKGRKKRDYLTPYPHNSRNTETKAFRNGPSTSGDIPYIL